MLRVVSYRRASLHSITSAVALAVGALGGALIDRSAQGQRAQRTHTINWPLFSQGRHPVTVGAAAPRTGAGASEDCALCHQEIAREWAASQHKSAWVDPVFRAAYDLEPMGFCRNCHAPLAPEGSAPSERAAREGVSCAVCHVRDGHVLSSGAGRGDAAGTSAPHGVRAEPRFSMSAYCAGCHQFNFPAETSAGGPLFDTDAPMQDTFNEWQRSEHALRGTQCQDCHMPWRTARDGARYRSHRFEGSRDPALLARAARVEATASREGASLVAHLRVLPADVGHAFPTGDLFRRLELRVWVEGAPQHAQVVSFARSFRDVYERGPHGQMAFVRRPASDSRVAPPGTGEPRTIELRFAGADRSATLIRWKLEHLLMPSPQAAAQGFSPALNRATVVEGSTVVSQGASR